MLTTRGYSIRMMRDRMRKRPNIRGRDGRCEMKNFFLFQSSTKPARTKGRSAIGRHAREDKKRRQVKIRGKRAFFK